MISFLFLKIHRLGMPERCSDFQSFGEGAMVELLKLGCH